MAVENSCGKGGSQTNSWVGHGMPRLIFVKNNFTRPKHSTPMKLLLRPLLVKKIVYETENCHT